MTLVNRLMDELHNTQTTPVARTLGKGKGKEVVEDSDIEELDGVRVIAWTYCSCSGGLVTGEERKVRSGRKAVGGGL